MDPTQTAMVFADTRIGMPFLLALAGGLLIACGYFLLRSWPPRPWRGAVLLCVAAICVLGIGYGLLDRRVVLDPVAGQVTRDTRILGMGREQVWSFGEFGAVRVVHRPTQSPRNNSSAHTPPSEPQIKDRYVIELAGKNADVRLRSYEDPFEAESVARGVARIGGWPAHRHGYELRGAGSDRPADGIAAGDLQRFETTSGQQGIGVSLDSWVQVRHREGAESVIEPIGAD